MSDNDVQLELKKRARRRLVGAVALALATVIALPMLMDNKPRVVENDLQVRLPGQESSATSRPLAAVPVDANEEIIPEEGASSPVASYTPEEPPAAQNSASVVPPVAEPDNRSVTEIAQDHSRGNTSTESRSPRAATSTTTPPKPTPTPPKVSPPPKAPATTNHAEAARAQAILNGASASATPRAPVTPTPAAASGKTRYYVQLGAYRDAANVASVQDRLKGSGISVSTEKIGDKTRVRAGPFSTREAAEQALAKLKNTGVNGNVVTVN